MRASILLKLKSTFYEDRTHDLNNNNNNNNNNDNNNNDILLLYLSK